jgi:signal transduction histidine kinase/pSer/pThr/pTyr-binding forkhead associated (FHA) protein
VLELTVLRGPDKGRALELPDDQPHRFGRSGEDVVRFEDTTISRRHAEVRHEEGQWVIEDLKSANGTFVNGVRVKSPRPLKFGDQVRVGNTVMMVGRKPGAEASAEQPQAASEGDGNVQRSVDAKDDSVVMAVSDPSEAQNLQLKMLYAVTSIIGSGEGRNALLERVVDLVFENFQADRAFILLRDHQDEDPKPVVVRHREQPSEQEKNNPWAGVSKTIVRHVMKKSVAVLSSNAMKDRRFASGDSVQAMGIRSTICVPIRTKEQLFGVIYVDSRVANYTFTDDQLRLLAAIGAQTGLAVANLELYAQRLRQERLAAVGQTVASLSHSIKNIIRGLDGGVEVVNHGLKRSDTSMIKRGWEITTRNIHRIRSLAMNMLAFSKQRAPDFERTSPAQVLEDVLGLVQKQFDDKGVMLINDVDQEMPPVAMDADGVHQAVLNLLNNALDAVAEGQGAVTLHAEFAPRDQQLIVHVADTGAGMDEATRKNLFEPFYSTKGFKGTGLGLVVAKKIAEEHSGRLEVASEEGKGTTVTLTLPAGESGQDKSETQAAAAQGEG